MQTWTDLAKTALLGTERQTPSLAEAGDQALQDLLAQIGGDDSEGALLAASGTLTVARRAGFLPSMGEGGEFPLAEAEDQPRCRRGAMRDLPLLLQGELEALLPEWLELIGKRGERVWERMLPELLDKGAKSERYRAAIRDVVGNRGRWLARQNAVWRYALGAESAPAVDDAVWETGLLEERVAYLRALRGREPAEAREKLREVWSQESPEARTALLNALHVGLKPEDDAFLESALGDRRAEVRGVAQDLARRLRESGLRRRMIERAGALVTRSADGRRIAVELPPEKLEKSWARDGIEPKSAQAYEKIGERAFVLRQVLANTTLRFWETHLRGTPDELIALAQTNAEWKELLLTGWVRALQMEPGPSPWGAPLLRYWLSSQQRATEAPWWRVVASDQLEAIVEKTLTLDALMDRGSVVRSLLTEPALRRSPRLVSRILAVLEGGANLPNSYPLLLMLPAIVDTFPEDMLEEAYAVWQRIDDGTSANFQEPRQKHMARRDFRRQMRRHISGE